MILKSSPKTLKLKSDDIDVKYGHIGQVLTDWIDTTRFVSLAGRGMAKSTVIIARRSFNCVYDMPGAPLAITANTYVNLGDNILPAVKTGWKLQGWIEGVHYIDGKRPPRGWRKRCSVIVDDYKHVISFWNGTVLFKGSLDNPSLLAGKSVVHLFFDEAKFCKDTKVSRAMPILRGDAITYGHSHYFLGVTITSDIPDTNEGEYDWFFRYAAEMDPERIIKIAQVASIRNEYLIKLAREKCKTTPSEAKINRILRKVEYYDRALLKLRKGQTFFMNSSSLMNVDILTTEYVKQLYSGTLELFDFLKSVLGMRPGLKKDKRFYVLFGEQHKYYNGTKDRLEASSSRELVFLSRDKPLEAGMDFGNQLSMVIGQRDGAYYRYHKNIYCLPPEWFEELSAKFRGFFINHECKQLDLYYDRAANNYERQKEDHASKFKYAIEHDERGHRTGWTVNLMSRKQSNIGQAEEFDFMIEWMGGKNRDLPVLLVDAINCPHMVSSIEKAPAEIHFNGKQKLVRKVKKSEKLELKKLPMESTNFSDAFKYSAMRKQWRDRIKGKKRSGANPIVPGYEE